MIRLAQLMDVLVLATIIVDRNTFYKHLGLSQAFSWEIFASSVIYCCSLNGDQIIA